MKRSDFLIMVSDELIALGVDKNEIDKCIALMERYLASAGVGEESHLLDSEDPKIFAREIYESIKVKIKKAEPQSAIDESEELPAPEEIILEDAEAPEDMQEEDPTEAAADELPTEEYYDEEDDDDMKIAPSGEPEDELGESLEELFYPDEEEEEGATREFNVSDLAAEGEDYEDIYEEDEYTGEAEYYEEELVKPAGNLIFFWILSVILAPVWVPLLAAAFIGVGVLYVLLVLFRFLYVPMLVALILGGSVTTVAELVYSIVKLVTGEKYIGLFELGLGFTVAALTVGFSVIIYRMGTKYAPGAVKSYWRNAKHWLWLLKKGTLKLMEVCSI